MSKVGAAELSWAAMVMARAAHAAAPEPEMMCTMMALGFTLSMLLAENLARELPSQAGLVVRRLTAVGVGITWLAPVEL